MNILSFDIEEWYNYGQMNGKKGNYVPDLDKVLYRLLDVLDEHNLKATCFCLGILARDYPYVIKAIADRGHEIGCHTDIHRKLWEMTPAQFDEDMHIAIDSLEQLTGQKVTMFRAPAFSLGKDNVFCIEILYKHGIRIDSSIFPGKRDFGGFPEFQEEKPCKLSYNGLELMEFPMNLATVMGREIAYSGGGYFRMLPYFLIKKIMKQKDYNMSYLHIHDFNGNQKRIISLRYVKNYYGNRTSFSKLNKYLHDFDFISLGEAANQIDWQSVPKITY